MRPELSTDIEVIQRMSAIPKILDSVAEMTGLRFVCVARVTENSWNACAILDRLEFGLPIGGSLDVSSTLCEQVRDTLEAVVIDDVSESLQYCDHHTPKIYGFKSYFSIPLFRPDGEYFGTLCGLDPLARDLSGTATLRNLNLFAELISRQLENERSRIVMEETLTIEREAAELREQFIAVLGHDLRTPLGSIMHGVDLMLLQGVPPASTKVIDRIKRSAQRMGAIVDDVVDFTRGRMGGGISIELRSEPAINVHFSQIVSELHVLYPDRQIMATFGSVMFFECDAGRMGQMLSNLLKNALVHGSDDSPVTVTTTFANGVFELDVSNSGVAIAEEVIPQLFKPFWRSNQKDKHQGLGLGLFIVSEIARSHGGEMEVISTPEKTSFTYRVKVQDSPGTLVR